MDGSGQINGQGSPWWRQAGNSDYINATNTNCNRPTALHFYNCNGLQLSGLNHLNSPRNHISISGCNGVTISNLHISAPQDSPNTDGIDISFSSHVNIHDCVIGTGDDCVALDNGSSIINITGVACGPGHGISVGSLGENGSHETVEEVLVQGCSFNGTENGARIKTWPGGSGYARHITFENITLIDVQNPIIIDQHYCNGEDHCRNDQGSAIKVSDVTYRLVQGSSASKKAIDLDCSKRVACTNIVMDQINITSAVPGAQIFASCNNAYGTSSSTTPNVPCLSKSPYIDSNLVAVNVTN
uniref:Endo-polygalacturonase n=1 Tax=Davidia involucrata TaxID=16924 RepID=A0A5B7C232_DAVIN